MKQIYAAFVKAQKAFNPALKSSVNPHFKSRYVGLDGCVEAVIDALNDNGIALIQETSECENGVIVETVFIHESGESMKCGKLHVPASKMDAQGYGSALTYARRYSLMAACGIAPEDDDGNAASKDIQGAKHKPTDNQDFKPDAEELQHLQGILDTILGLESDYEAIAAFIPTQKMDADEKTWVWDKLDSKTRSGIKAVKPKE